MELTFLVRGVLLFARSPARPKPLARPLAPSSALAWSAQGARLLGHWGFDARPMGLGLLTSVMTMANWSLAHGGISRTEDSEQMAPE